MQWCHVISGRQNAVTQGAVFDHHNLYIYLGLCWWVPSVMHDAALQTFRLRTEIGFRSRKGSQDCSSSRAFRVSTFYLPNATWNNRMWWHFQVLFHCIWIEIYTNTARRQWRLVNRLTCSQTLKLSVCSEIKLSSTQMVELLRPLSLPWP